MAWGVRVLQRLLNGWYAAAARREGAWQAKEEMAHLRWTRAVYAAEKADRED